ncbi:hypothetical protein [Paenibacillus assamensis]|uniref:hypothetical protein n=1 Tax=Paenibacillus assamensis TaxID=311244 RepID=UPI0003F60EDC|nr:hypothetical protein [Paenibacillus assamensis]
MTNELHSQFDAFINSAAFSLDPCTVATAIALTNQPVREKLIEKFNAGYMYNGYGCLKVVGNLGVSYVAFKFSCPAGVHCFINPSFVAVVNLVTKKVIDIIDPFHVSEYEELRLN